MLNEHLDRPNVLLDFATPAQYKRLQINILTLPYKGVYGSIITMEKNIRLQHYNEKECKINFSKFILNLEKQKRKRKTNH